MNWMTLAASMPSSSDPLVGIMTRSDRVMAMGDHDGGRPLEVDDDERGLARRGVDRVDQCLLGRAVL